MKKWLLVLVAFSIAVAIVFAGCTVQVAQNKTAALNDSPQKTKPSVQRQTKPPLQSQSPQQSSTADGKGVLYLGIMVHLEGWNDSGNKAIFQDHASKLRDFAALFEKYGAKLTLESKEFTAGCIKWGDNVLLEMQNRGHSIGLHADVGGSSPKNGTAQMTTELKSMKQELESLGVTVRHASGVVSKADWVKACIDAGFDFASGVVAYALWSLDPGLRPAEFEPYPNPAAGHAAYPFDLEGKLHPWRAKDGSNWILDDPSGQLVIMPSGDGLTHAGEEASGQVPASREYVFDSNDVTALKQTIEEALSLCDNSKVNTLYFSWSFGQVPDKNTMEAFLQMADTFVKSGKVAWRTIPQMYDEYMKSIK